MEKNTKVLPFVWPWRVEGSKTFKEWLKTRKFSIVYLVIIWIIVSMLGFASTRLHDCGTSWELSFYCEYAFWAKNLREAPLIYLRNLFTTLFFHNGVDHILFVSVVGVLLIIQSHEFHFGSSRTFLTFLSAYVIVAPILGAFYVVGLDLYPESWFFQFAFERNWMGGSLGMFQVYGSLSRKSRKPLIMLFIPVVFEALNLSLGIDPHISIMHLTSLFTGFGLSFFLIKST